MLLLYYSHILVIIMSFYFIQLGEEVTENYYPVFTIMAKDVRQEFLKSHIFWPSQKYMNFIKF